MSKAIEQISGKTVGHAGLGMHGANVGSPRQQIHDGDTLGVRLLGDLGVRFLGVDSPEISFQLPKSSSFVSLGDARWEEFLSAPFDTQWGTIKLEDSLRTHLQARVGPGCATNHHKYAKLAEDALEAAVIADMAALAQTKEQFEFFLSFAREVMDGYGRLLAYCNRNQTSGERPPSYNERQLLTGAASPLFIWPNINPFRRQSGLRAAVFKPGSAASLAHSEASLRKAREAIANNRTQGIGIFDHTDPLRLEAGELRFLARRSAPTRWVIDLSREDNILVPPQAYHSIAHSEDRLYIPDEYTELFISAGWRKG